MTARYAIYFSPGDDTELASFGAYALGRVPNGSEIFGQKESVQSKDVLSDNRFFSDQLTAANLRATPAHYGFHATLKAPFQLKETTNENDFLLSVNAFSRMQKGVCLETLLPRKLAGFMALTLESQPASLSELAAQCVRTFEPFRAALTESDVRKRQPENLNDQQKAYLFEFGYPYVLREFRFHMTLTGALVDSKYEDYTAWLVELYSELVREIPVLDRLAVFKQPDRSSPFIRLAEFPFL